MAAMAEEEVQQAEKELRAAIDGALAAADLWEPSLCALLPLPGESWRRRLEREGEALMERVREGERGPLFGQIVGIKDIFNVNGLPTKGGSELPAEVLTGEEGTLIKRLRSAGALIMGKLTTTEFAYFKPAPTDNPRAPGHTPGGSSSGSAAAVAAGICTISVGSN